MDPLQLEAGAVRGDRLQSGKSVFSGCSDLGAHRLDPTGFRHPLDPEYRPRVATGKLTQPAPVRSRSRRRKAVVDEQRLRPRGTQQRRRVLRRIGNQPVLVHGFLGRRAPEELGELAQRAPVREPGCDVRPLPRVWALREEAAELVDGRGRLEIDAVRVMVDEADRAQYFEKWPCCSNASSPAE